MTSAFQKFAHERHGLLIARAYADGVNLVRLGLVTRQSVELRLLATARDIPEAEALTAIRRGLAAAGAFSQDRKLPAAMKEKKPQ